MPQESLGWSVCLREKPESLWQWKERIACVSLFLALLSAGTWERILLSQSPQSCLFSSHMVQGELEQPLGAVIPHM